MPRQIALLIVTLALVLSGVGRDALAAVQAEGRGEVPYDTSLFSSKPDAAARQSAVTEAKKNALTRYASGFSAAKYALFQADEPKIYAQLEQYVIDAVVVDEGANKSREDLFHRGPRDDQRYQAGCVAERPRRRQCRASGAGGTAISYLFVARETESSKAFDTRRTIVADAQKAVSASQGQGVSGGKANFSESAEATSSLTTGGSALRKADEVSYRVTSPENINTAMTEIFASNGFEVYDYREVVSQCGGVDPQKIYAEFAKADELARDTRNSAFTAARQCSISVFAFGTLDVGLQDVDPVTGNKRVYVSVRSQLLDITGKLPRIIASVGPVQYAGLGPDQTVATRNALQLAATEVARAISDQMNAKGAH
ncbi:MAG: hypothetical protein WDN69_30025 [Aliidongia sp.]